MKKYKRDFLNSKIFTENAFFYAVIRKMFFLLFVNRRIVKGKNNTIDTRGLLLNSRIKILGNNNVVRYMPGGVAKRINIEIIGDNNVIDIREYTHFTKTKLSCWDNKNKIIIGKNGNFGESNLTCLEGTKLKIGNGCLVSYGVEIRTSDGHAIFDMNQNRLNEARDITINNNVWLAQKCLIFKGAKVPSGCVIGANSLVNKHLDNNNCIYVGSPVRAIRKNIRWTHDR